MTVTEQVDKAILQAKQGGYLLAYIDTSGMSDNDVSCALDHIRRKRLNPALTESFIVIGELK